MRTKSTWAAVLAMAVVPLVAAACTSTGSGGAGPSGVSTTSTFTFAPAATAAAGPTSLIEPLYLYQTAPSTSWSQSVTLTSGTSDVATSQVSLVAGPTVAADGTIAGQLQWTVTGAGTTTAGASLLTNPPATMPDVTCTTTATSSECSAPVTIPAPSPGNPVIGSLGISRFGQDAATGNWWWFADVTFGATQSNVGFIGVPGGLTVDPSVPVTNSTLYTGSATSCTAIAPSNVLWLSPHDQAATRYAAYTSSTTAAGTCNASFRPVSLGGSVTGVYVQAPVPAGASS